MWDLLSDFFLICHFSLTFSLTVLCTVFFIRTRDIIVSRLLLILLALFVHSFASLFYFIFSEDLTLLAGQITPGISLFLLVLTCVTVPLIIYGTCSYMLSCLALPDNRRRIGKRIITACSIIFFLFGLYFIVFLHGNNWLTALTHALNELFIYGSLFLFFPAIAASIFIGRTADRRKKKLLCGIIISFIPIGLFAVFDLLFFVNSPYKLVYISYFVFSILVYLFTSRHYVHRYAPEKVNLPEPNADIYRIMDISDREKELIPLLLEGNSYKQISELLFISPNTVKTHVRNIYRKAKVSNRLQLLSKINNHHESL